MIKYKAAKKSIYFGFAAGKFFTVANVNFCIILKEFYIFAVIAEQKIKQIILRDICGNELGVFSEIYTFLASSLINE